MCSENGSTAGTATVEVVEDGERVRIVRYILAPGASTGWHRHEHDYVIVPYDDMRVRVTSASGVVEAAMHRNKPYHRERGAEHDVTSLEPRTVSFLEIEIK